MLELAIKGCKPEKENDDYIVNAVISSDDVKVRMKFEEVGRKFSDDIDVMTYFGGSLIFSNVPFITICMMMCYLSIFYNTDSYIIVDDLDFFGTDISIKKKLVHIAGFYYDIKRG